MEYWFLFSPWLAERMPESDHGDYWFLFIFWLGLINCPAEPFYKTVLLSCLAQLSCQTVLPNCPAESACKTIVPNCPAKPSCWTILLNWSAEPTGQLSYRELGCGIQKCENQKPFGLQGLNHASHSQMDGTRWFSTSDRYSIQFPGPGWL